MPLNSVRIFTKNLYEFKIVEVLEFWNFEIIEVLFNKKLSYLFIDEHSDRC